MLISPFQGEQSISTPDILFDIEGIILTDMLSICTEESTSDITTILEGPVREVKLSFDIGHKPFLIDIYRKPYKTSLVYSAHYHFGYFRLYKTDEPLAIKRLKLDIPSCIDFTAALIRIPNLNWFNKEIRILISKDAEGNGETSITTTESSGYTQLSLGSLIHLGAIKELILNI